MWRRHPLIAFITDPAPIRRIFTHVGEPLEPPPLAPDELPVIDIHSP